MHSYLKRLSGYGLFPAALFLAFLACPNAAADGVTPNPVVLTQPQGSTQTVTATATVSGPAGTYTTTTNSSNCPGFFTINPASGAISSSGTTLIIATNPAVTSTLAPTKCVGIGAIFDGNTTITFGVDDIITAPASPFTVSPTSINFTTQAGSTAPQTQTVTVTGSTSALLTYTVISLPQSPGPDFIKVDKPSGTLSGTTPVPLTLTLNTAQTSGLATGPYQDTLLVSTGSGSTQYSVTVPVTLTVTPASTTPIDVSPRSQLLFDGFRRGEPTSPRYLEVTSAGSGQASFSVTIDDGLGGSADWLTVSPTIGATPARLAAIANPGALSAGTKNARIGVTATGLTTPIYVPVQFTVIDSPPKLSVAPPVIYGPPEEGPLGRTLVASQAGGGGPLNYTASLTDLTGGISVTPFPSAATFTYEEYFDYQYDGASRPTQRDLTTINANSPDGTAIGTVTVPVIVPAQPTGPDMALSQFGITAIVRNGSAPPPIQTLPIFNLGTGSLNYSATSTFPNGTPSFFNIQTGTNTSATPTQPGAVNLSFTPPGATFSDGFLSGLVTVSAPNVAGAPQYVAVNLITSTSTAPVVTTQEALAFTLNAGAAPTTKTVQVFVDNLAPMTFQAAVNSANGGQGFSIGAPVGTLSSANPGVISVTADASKLQTGVNRGEVDVLVGGQMKVVSLLALVRPAGSNAAEPKTARAAACAPTRVVISSTGIASAFSRPVGFPGVLSVSLFDDCGSVLFGPKSSVIATFDTGDAPLTLFNLGSAAGVGAFVATWTPLFPTANATITLTATSAGLAPDRLQISGAVQSNNFSPPVLFENGTVNNTNPLGGPLLAPGTVTAAYGQNLATSTASPGLIPLPNTFNGTTLNMGGLAAPFYFLSSGQLNVQTPYELTPNQNVAVAVQVGSAFAVLPKGITLAPAAPGISSFADTHIIAQHADFTLIDVAHPAKPNEPIVTYVSGMGATNPGFATGQQVPSMQLASDNLQPTVTVNGTNAMVIYAGLTPGGIGLYQINFTVPAGIAAGDATVVVTQNGIVANITKLPVGAP